MRLPFLPCLLLTAVLANAENPVLENTGKPMRLPFQCSQDDIRIAGLTCPAEHPCPVYVELGAIEVVGSKILLAGNLHAETVTLSSLLLVSSDAGKTWTEPHERIRGAGLDSIQFLDFANGWISGQILGAIPRDPFLLITHDGGKTWYSRPVFSEGREGLLDAFHFDSKSHGVLWIDRSQSGETEDRYESLESETGGDSWTLRETSAKPLRTGPRVAGPSEWRLRADSATKSHRLERRAASGWEAVASFAVTAGECREEETTLAPEPPPETEPQDPAKVKPPTLKKLR